MTTFKVETENIISLLLQTYKWLLNGKEKLALLKLAHCAESATEMSDSAEKLARSFEQLQVKSTVARSNTIEAEASAKERQEKAEQAERETIASQKAEQVKRDELAGQISQMQALFDDAKEREEAEAKKAFITTIISAVTTTIGAGLGAYSALKNPISLVTGGSDSGSSGVDKEALVEAQKKAEEKKKTLDEAQSKLLDSKEQRDRTRNAIDSLDKEIKEIEKNIEKLNGELKKNTDGKQVNDVGTRIKEKESELVEKTKN
ncbi:Uncharacterised protein [Chromobacterium violaceum]|uniref:Uncharacterized protein n=1 Tax=Chromobacterium violaceum TaxID=536 RepID=A0A3S4IDH7_CHRVL|nr:Uncharacterised protein [Chromobacterium violaceum]